MKKTIILAVLLFTFKATTYSQTEEVKPTEKKPYKVWVHDDKDFTTKGVLYSTNDTGITVVSKGQGGIPDYHKFSAEQIEKLKLQRKGSMGTGMWKGAIIGFISGAILGIVSGDDPKEMMFSMTAGAKALTLGIGLGATGAIIGGTIGALAKKKFVIGKDRNRYKKIQADLIQRSISY